MTPTHYLLSASDVAKVHEALTINRVMAKDDQGNYTKEITPKVITEALAILQSAQGVVIVGYSVTCNDQHSGNYFFNKQNAEKMRADMDSRYPAHPRTVADLFGAIQGDSNEG
jgi:hypothetical protein